MRFEGYFLPKDMAKLNQPWMWSHSKQRFVEEINSKFDTGHSDTTYPTNALTFGSVLEDTFKMYVRYRYMRGCNICVKCLKMYPRYNYNIKEWAAELVSFDTVSKILTNPDIWLIWS